jgi:hypothetical protein
MLVFDGRAPAHVVGGKPFTTEVQFRLRLNPSVIYRTGTGSLQLLRFLPVNIIPLT